MPKEIALEAAVAWRLYDTANKMFFNNLHVGQVLKILQSIPPADLRFWHVCKNDGPDWFPLSEKIVEIQAQSTAMPAGVVSLGQFVDEMIKTKTGVTKTTKTRTKVDKRKNPRHSQKLTCFIDVGDNILSCHTKDISLVSIKLMERFPINYAGKYYPLVLKTKPPMTLRCTPMITEKEHIRGKWRIVKLDPSFNLTALAKYLGEEVILPKKK